MKQLEEVKKYEASRLNSNHQIIIDEMVKINNQTKETPISTKKPRVYIESKAQQTYQGFDGKFEII